MTRERAWHQELDDEDRLQLASAVLNNSLNATWQYIPKKLENQIATALHSTKPMTEEMKESIINAFEKRREIELVIRAETIRDTYEPEKLIDHYTSRTEL